LLIMFEFSWRARRGCRRGVVRRLTALVATRSLSRSLAHVSAHGLAHGLAHVLAHNSARFLASFQQHAPTLLALSILATASAVSARPTAVRAEPGAEPLRIDGRLDDAAWTTAPVHDAFTQYRPVDGVPAPADYRTTVQIVVEEHAIVFGIRAFDPRPDEIRAPLIRRDEVRRDQDFVIVVLDPVGTRQSAQFVRVNAAGVVADGMYIAATDNEDFAPDFEFDAAAQRTADGYSVEIRMPLLSLRYPYEGGAPWRLMVGRNVPRDAVRLLLTAPLKKDSLNFIAELQEIDGPGDIAERARSHALLSVRPELTLRSSRRTDEQSSADSRKFDAGAQIKWRPRADWVVDATLNPDFSQVELDVPQLAGNTRFALSVPEKRPFFLESTDVIDLPLAGFYSRSVTDPRWGLRATWRGTQADATAFSLRDDGGGLVLLPGPYATGVALQERPSQATLLRGRLHRDGLTAGALLASRDQGDGRTNHVIGADALWRQSEEQQFRVRALGSQTSALFGAAGQPVRGDRQDGHHLFASWWRRIPGWNFTAEASRTSPRFRNDNGFVEQAGVDVLQAELIRRYGATTWAGVATEEFENYLWMQQKRALADRASMGANGSVNGNDIAGGEVISRSIHPGIWLSAARNTEAWFHVVLDAARARAGGQLHSTRGVAGAYSVNPAPWWPRLATEFEWGRRLDFEADRVGRGAKVLLEANLRGQLPNGWGVESQQRVQHSFVNAPGGERALSESNARWLGVLHLSARDALRIVWQGTRFVRSADASVGLAAAREDTATTSAVFQRRFGVGRSINLGVSRQSAKPGTSRETEVFLKLSFDLLD
jgi:hypothetical protein